MDLRWKTYFPHTSSGIVSVHINVLSAGLAHRGNTIPSGSRTVDI